MESLGKVDFEEEIRKRKEPIYVPNWFTVDAKTGVSFPLFGLFLVLHEKPPTTGMDGSSHITH